MEKCKNIEEIFMNGERKLIFHYDSKNLSLNEKNLLGLLLQFGSINCLKEFFNGYKFDDIEKYFKKYNINYIIG